MRFAVAVLVLVCWRPAAPGRTPPKIPSRWPLLRRRRLRMPPSFGGSASSRSGTRSRPRWRGGCEESFDHDVGQAPASACGASAESPGGMVDLVRGLDLEQTALRQGDGARLAEANELIRKSEAGLEAALNRVRTVVPDVEKPLPVSPPRAREAEPTPPCRRWRAVVGSRVEIRCWNKEDWRRPRGCRRRSRS